jgi:outer membrane lipoprotein carrier protein
MKQYLRLFILCLVFPHSLLANESLDHFLQDLHTLQGQFQQELYNEKGTLLEKSQGKMSMQRPNQFYWEYLYPYNQLLVADGVRVWVYDIDLEQVTVKKMDKTIGKTPAFLLSFERKLDEDFFVNKLATTENKTRFELIPKDSQAQFDSIRIDVWGKNLLGFELVDNLGQTTHIKFHQMTRNQRVDSTLFIFTPPAGIDIIEDE